MEHPHKPIDTIKTWQDWYKNHRIVAEMDEPLVTKESRESLHDTSNATDVFPDWRSFFKELTDDVDLKVDKEDLSTKATNYFADTIVEFLPELGGQRLYECFVAAAKQVHDHIQKEYDDVKDLFDLVK